MCVCWTIVAQFCRGKRRRVGEAGKNGQVCWDLLFSCKLENSSLLYQMILNVIHDIPIVLKKDCNSSK